MNFRADGIWKGVGGAWAAVRGVEPGENMINFEATVARGERVGRSDANKRATLRDPVVINVD
jgi:hypothetical protein